MAGPWAIAHARADAILEQCNPDLGLLQPARQIARATEFDLGKTGPAERGPLASLAFGRRWMHIVIGIYPAQ